MQALKFREILRTLCAHRVDFIVVGGISAVLQGAPLNTFDIDIVHLRSPENISRLLAALREMDALYRMQPERRLRPAEFHLESKGHNLLLTRFGPLDVLGSIGKGRDFNDLIGHTSEWKTEGDTTILILNLEQQIEIKEEVGAPKDLAALPLLRRTLIVRNARKKPV